MPDETVWLKPEQVDSLRDACYDVWDSPEVRKRNDSLIALAYDAGLRPSELVQVTREMLHLDDSSITLPGDAQKDYATSTSPSATSIRLGADEFTRDTVRTLKQFLDVRSCDSVFVFCGYRTDAISTRMLRKILKQAAIEAEIEPYAGSAARGGPADVTPYALRHSVAWRVLRACDDSRGIWDVRDRLRHTQLTTTERFYDHFDIVE